MFHLKLYWLFWYWNLQVEDKVNKVVVVIVCSNYLFLSIILLFLSETQGPGSSEIINRKRKQTVMVF